MSREWDFRLCKVMASIESFPNGTDLSEVSVFSAMRDFFEN